MKRPEVTRDNFNRTKEITKSSDGSFNDALTILLLDFEKLRGKTQ